MLIVRDIPTTPWITCGAPRGWPSRSTLRPLGTLASVSVPTSGRTSANATPTRPPESSTCREIRYHTFADVSPMVGTVNSAPATPDVARRTGWKWVSWWKLTDQVNAPMPMTPSSRSVAVPVKLMRSPAR